MATTLGASNPLGAIGGVNSIGNWVDAIDQESKQLSSAAHRRTENFDQKTGINTVIEYIMDNEKGLCKVTSEFKVITKTVPRSVAQRRTWTKFGRSANDGPGPQAITTYVGEDVSLQFIRNRAGDPQPDESLEEQRRTDPMKGVASKGHCRICKADDHWSVNCPYKDMYPKAEDEMMPGSESERNASLKMVTAISGGGGGAGAAGGALAQGAAGRYVNPFARGDRIATAAGLERRSDDFTCRVTNLPEDSETLDEDLRSMFGSVGRIERFYLARDKMTNKPKGFAFITFSNRMDAERAIDRFNGAKLEHLVLRVEWTKPSVN